ncbi:MAG: flavodoxin [Peptoniphilaceae bacterium]|nr:flavodoxin [Peptoniphilaceae bacterium]MDY6018879.1 flavodoxin [Anaerococcus sp.]
MTKDLVLYFSKSGNTERIGKLIAENTGADLFEIKEKEEYTKEDLNWHDPESRVTKEMGDLDAHPQVKELITSIDGYERIFLGFPIWWYTVPKVVLTFLENYDFSEKELVVFGTSAMSDLGEAVFAIEKAIDYKTEIKGGDIFDGRTDIHEIKEWLKAL